MKRLQLAAWVLVCLASPAFAAITIPGDTSDGSLVIPVNTTIDLSLAATAAWDTPGSGNGVYDASKWAVVFKYSSVTISTNATLTFTNHPSRAPVVWLVQGNVTITGNVNLNGGNGIGPPFSFAEPGPGGFRGGIGGITVAPGSGGFGPGGGARDKNADNFAGSGSYATAIPDGGIGENGAIYGNAAIVPLIGGSGGASDQIYIYGGGAGGGAILIAASGTINVNGMITATGGQAGVSYAGNGSGGAIRLVADAVTGTGILRAQSIAPGTNGGDGRIRVEANTISLNDPGLPATSNAIPAVPPVIWPDTSAPVIVSATLAGLAVPSDPRAVMTVTGTDLRIPDQGDAPLVVMAMNVPNNSTVTARVVRKIGQVTTIPLTFTPPAVGATTTWTGTVTLAGGILSIQVRAVLGP